MLAGKEYDVEDANDFGRSINVWEYITLRDGKYKFKLNLEQVARNRFKLVHDRYPTVHDWKSCKYFVDSLIHFHPQTYGIRGMRFNTFSAFEKETYEPSDCYLLDRNRKEIPVKKSFKLEAKHVLSLCYALISDYRRMLIFTNRFEELVFIKSIQLKIHEHQQENTNFVFTASIMKYDEFRDLVEQDKIAKNHLPAVALYLGKDLKTCREEWIADEKRKYLANYKIKTNESWNANKWEDKMQYLWRYSGKETRIQLLEKAGVDWAHQIMVEADKFKVKPCEYEALSQLKGEEKKEALNKINEKRTTRSRIIRKLPEEQDKVIMNDKMNEEYINAIAKKCGKYEIERPIEYVILKKETVKIGDIYKEIEVVEYPKTLMFSFDELRSADFLGSYIHDMDGIGIITDIKKKEVKNKIFMDITFTKYDTLREDNDTFVSVLVSKTEAKSWPDCGYTKDEWTYLRDVHYEDSIIEMEY